MAQEPAQTDPDKRAAKARKRAVGKSVRQRLTKQAAAKPGQMEAEEQDLSRYCERNGQPMERICIVSAWELPECDCCGEPWCPVHMEHYGDCECVGPSNAEDEGWELEERDGILYGIRPLSAGGCVDPNEGAGSPVNISRMNANVELPPPGSPASSKTIPGG